MATLSIYRAHPLKVSLFLLPALILFAGFFVYPLLFVVGISFTEWNGVNDPAFVGIQNYLDNFGDSNFVTALVNNVIWAVSLGGIQVLLALIVALILSRKPKGWRFLRTIYFLPNVISKIAIATLWLAMYNAEYGAINVVLEAIGLSGITANWLGLPNTALPAVILQELLYIGYFMIIIFAGRQSIPEVYYDAARIDGAGPVKQDLLITIPLLKPLIITAATLGIAFGLRHFEGTFLMTRGGPANATTVLGLQMYNKLGALDYGHASAISVTLIILGVVFIGLLQLAFRGRRRETSNE